MQSYRIRDVADDERKPTFKKTRKDAHEAARELLMHIGNDNRDDILIEQVEIGTSSNDIHEYLNGLHPTHPEILARFKFTRRGGLVEVDAAGAPLKDPS